MPRGIDAGIKAKLDATLVAGIFYLVRITLSSTLVKYYAERAITYGGHAYLPKVLDISRIPQTIADSGEISIVLANVDGEFTTLERTISFLGAKVELIEYLDDPVTPLAHVKWIGWADDLRELSVKDATLVAYSGNPTIRTEIPKRTIQASCPWVFAAHDASHDSTDFDGSECPYRNVSTVGFVTTTSEGINDSDDPVTFTHTALPDSQLYRLDDEIKLDNEIMRITAVGSGNVTAIRGQRGTTITSHISGTTVLFSNCHYTVAACKRRGMYGNNTSDTYSSGGSTYRRNYFGGFPLITGQVTGRYKMRDLSIWAKTSISFAGNESAYGKTIPLIYGRCRLLDPPLLVARNEGKAGEDQVFVCALFAVCEGTLACNASNGNQDNPMNAYAVAADGMEAIYVNGKRRHDPRAGWGIWISGGYMDQPPPPFSGVPEFTNYMNQFAGTAMVMVRIKEDNNSSGSGAVDCATGQVDGDFEIRYGRCVRVYTTPSAYTFKPTTSPADVLFDYETSKRAGGGLAYSRVNIQSFIDARTYCAETVTSVVDGSSVPRWTFNGAIDGKKSFQEHERIICTGMYCLPPFLDKDGKYKIKMLKQESIDDLPIFSSTSGTSRNILIDRDGASTLTKNRKSMLEVPNEVKVNFVAYENGQWIKTQLVLADREAQTHVGAVLGDNSLKAITRTLDLPGVTTIDEAARIGTLVLRAGDFAKGGTANNLTIIFDAFYKDTSDLELGDLIQVEDALLDPVNEAFFRIVNMEDESVDVEGGGFLFKRKIACTLHDNAIYDDTAFTCTDLTRHGIPGGFNQEAPAVTNFQVLEQGVYDRHGIPHAKITFTYDEPGEYRGAAAGSASQNDETIDVDGITPTDLALKLGDTLRIEGHIRHYHLTSDVTLSGGAGTLPLDIGLEFDVADNALLSVIRMEERNGFKDVVIERSTTDSLGQPVNDWRFVTEIIRAPGTIYYEITNKLECFAALSQNLAGGVPDPQTKDSADNFKYPRQCVLVDGSTDGANPSGAHDLQMLTTTDDATIPTGHVVFQFHRDTANYSSIYAVACILSVDMPGEGPYSAERTAHSDEVIEVGTCHVTAGETTVQATRPGGDDPDVQARVLCIYTPDGDPDSDLDADIITGHGADNFVISKAFSKSGDFSYAVIKRFWHTGTGGDTTNSVYAQFPVDTFVKEAEIWRTPPIPAPNGTFYGTVYARNTFGVGTRLTAGPKTIGEGKDQVTSGVHMVLNATGLAIRAGWYSDAYTASVFEGEFRAQYFPIGSDVSPVDMRLASEGGSWTPNGTTKLHIQSIPGTYKGANWFWTSTDHGRWYCVGRLKNNIGWSLWTDGNETPSAVVDFVDTEKADSADDGPPSNWSVWLIYGPQPDTYCVCATRPKINGSRIWWMAAQIKDGSVGGAYDVDAGTSTAPTYYDGSAISHTLSLGGKRITRDSGSGFGTTHIGDLIICDVTAGDFSVHYCEWGTVSAIEGGDPTTATWIEVDGAFVPLTGDTTDIRIKVVKMPNTWVGDGFFGDELGGGMSELSYWKVGGDKTQQVFTSPPIKVPPATDPSILIGRVWFDNLWSRADDNKCSIMGDIKEGFPTQSGCTTLPIVAGHVSTDASLGTVFYIKATENFILDKPTGLTYCGQPVAWIIEQADTGDKAITLDIAFIESSNQDVNPVMLVPQNNTRHWLGTLYYSPLDVLDVVAFVRDYRPV